MGDGTERLAGFAEAGTGVDGRGLAWRAKSLQWHGEAQSGGRGRDWLGTVRSGRVWRGADLQGRHGAARLGVVRHSEVWPGKAGRGWHGEAGRGEAGLAGRGWAR